MRQSLMLLTIAVVSSVFLLGQQGCPSDFDGDGFAVSDGDCDDSNPSVYPGATENCNGVDDNCDRQVDEGWDMDNDGVTVCALEPDCDDGDPEVYPGQVEYCDQVDNNCDGEVDEGWDMDGDGVLSCEGDCDDDDPDVNDLATEICNEIDDNCDGQTDEGFDQDLDGYTSCGGDCDDTTAEIRPGREELCNGIDDDCDDGLPGGGVDEDFDRDLDGYTTCAGDCADEDASINPAASELCNSKDDDCDGSVDEGYDADLDGYRICDDDCDDASPEVHPDAQEQCNAIDDNCDGAIDEGYDADEDGYTTCGGDCDDTNAAVHPAATERCNQVDDDCDGATDEGYDADGDGYTTCGGDCNDTSPSVHSGATELCNQQDDDCDGDVDEGYDQDGDGYTACGGDCNDADPLVHPAATEGPEAPSTTSDGIDNDCDGYVDIDCDGTSMNPFPMVVVDSPERGTYTTSSSVQVSGHVLPALGRIPVEDVEMASGSLTVAACSDDGGILFSGSASLSHGLNTLRIQTYDALGGSDKAEVSVISSSSFVDVQNQPISGALTAELNQGSWNILADFLEGYLSADDIEAELLASNPLLYDSGDDDCLEKWEIYGEATAYSHDDVDISFLITGGKIRSTARIVRPQMWATGWAYYDLEWYCGGWDDTVGLDAYISFSEVSATADAVPTVNANGEVVIEFTNVSVTASGATVDIDADSSIYDWLIGLFEEDIEAALETFIEDELREYVEQDLGPLAADELNALSLAYDIDLMGIAYGVALDIESISVPTGTVDIGFEMGLNYPVDSRIPSNPGAVHFDTNHTPTTSPTVAFKVGLDFFNTALHAVWEGGAMNLSGTISEDPAMYVIAEPLLPPVVTPGPAPYIFDLMVGDVLATLEIPQPDGTEAVLSAAASARVDMDLDPKIDGYDIWFDVTFSQVDLSFDVVGDIVLEPDLQADMEQGLSEMLTIYLADLEYFLESQTISYLEIPIQFHDIWIEADASNPAMLTLAAEASYTGP